MKASDKAAKKVTAKCGHEVPFPKDGALPTEFSAWHSEVDCPECLA